MEEGLLFFNQGVINSIYLRVVLFLIVPLMRIFLFLCRVLILQRVPVEEVSWLLEVSWNIALPFSNLQSHTITISQTHFNLWACSLSHLSALFFLPLYNLSKFYLCKLANGLLQKKIQPPPPMKGNIFKHLPLWLDLPLEPPSCLG